MIVWAGEIGRELEDKNAQPPDPFAAAPPQIAPSPGASYDPEQRRWYPIPLSPVRPHPLGLSQVVVVGDSLVVLDDAEGLPPNEDCDTAYLYGAEYQPSTDTWRDLPRWSARSVTPFVAAWDGDRVVAVTSVGAPHGRWTSMRPSGPSCSDKPTSSNRRLPSEVRRSAWSGSSRRGRAPTGKRELDCGRAAVHRPRQRGPCSTPASARSATWFSVASSPRRPARCSTSTAGSWHRMPSPKGAIGMSLSGGRAWWTGRGDSPSLPDRRSTIRTARHATWRSTHQVADQPNDCPKRPIVDRSLDRVAWSVGSRSVRALQKQADFQAVSTRQTRSRWRSWRSPRTTRSWSKAR